jgi:hypothetical protein
MVQPMDVDREEKKIIQTDGYSHQAFEILRFAFAIIPIIAGLDKLFAYILTNWEQYLSTPFNVFQNARTTMIIVGVIEFRLCCCSLVITHYYQFVYPRRFLRHYFERFRTLIGSFSLGSIKSQI